MQESRIKIPSLWGWGWDVESSPRPPRLDSSRILQSPGWPPWWTSGMFTSSCRRSIGVCPPLLVVSRCDLIMLGPPVIQHWISVPPHSRKPLVVGVTWCEMYLCGGLRRSGVAIGIGDSICMTLCGAPFLDVEQPVKGPVHPKRAATSALTGHASKRSTVICPHTFIAMNELQSQGMRLIHTWALIL